MGSLGVLGAQWGHHGVCGGIMGGSLGPRGDIGVSGGIGIPMGSVWGISGPQWGQGVVNGAILGWVIGILWVPLW